MNQIAIGSYDPIGEWLVLHGEGIIAPFKQADYQPVFGTGEEVAETIQLSLEGTPGELAEVWRHWRRSGSTICFITRPAIQRRSASGSRWWQAVAIITAC